MQQEMELSKFEFYGDGKENVQNWKKIKQIGCGQFSHVYHAKAFTTIAEVDVAVKEINFGFNNDEKASKAARTETDVFKKLSHERIVSFYGFCPKDFSCFIFIEFMPLGSLYNYIRENKVLPEDIVQLFTKQLLDGIHYLHSQRVLHRDIKTGNILMSSETSVKLTDFGLSKLFGEYSKASTTGVGTPRYMAPEMFIGRYSYPVDIWALGCVVVEMLTGNFPFPKLENQQVMFYLYQEKTPLQSVEQKLPNLAELFLTKIFKPKPEDRPSALTLLLNDHYIPGKRKLNHEDFIPIREFTLENLPESDRNKDLYELIKAVAALTVRVDIRMTSPKRPEDLQLYPLYNMKTKKQRRIGSGEIFIFHYNRGHVSGINENIFIPDGDFSETEYKTCPCEKCQDSETPSNVWYEIFVTTATHSIYDDIEAAHTSCRLFYDDDKDKTAVTLNGFSIVTADVKKDLTIIKNATCDISLGDKLCTLSKYKNDLLEKNIEKYQDVTSELCFIVSHPYGYSKHVSIGQLSQIIYIAEHKKLIELKKLFYTIATCPGSDGASVYWAGRKNAHVHSGARSFNLIYSSTGYFYKK